MKTSTKSSGTHRLRHYRLRTTQLLLLLLVHPMLASCTLLTSINSRHVVELDFSHRLSAALVDQEGPVDSWRMTNITVLDKKFQCVLPNLGGGGSVARRRMSKQGLEYLRKSRTSFLSKKCDVFKKPSDEYWTYEICYGKEIVQYHRVKSSSAFSLGVHDPTMDVLHSNGSVTQHYVNGTDNRRTSLVFVCSHKAGPTSPSNLSEPHVLNYLIHYPAPSFCDWRPPSAQQEEKLRLEYLLRPLEGLCINQTQGWWTYEFCYPSHLRQFHVNNRGQTEEPIYSLGALPPHIEAAAISRQQNMEENIVGKKPPYFHHYAHDEPSGGDDAGSVDAELPIGFYESSPQQQGGSGAVAGRSLQKPRVHKSLRLNLTEGTLCEDISVSRRSRVIFECPEDFVTNPLTRLEKIVEVSLCEYEMVVYTPYVCAHPDLVPPRPKDHEVVKCFLDPHSQSRRPIPASFRDLPPYANQHTETQPTHQSAATAQQRQEERDDTAAGGGPEGGSEGEGEGDVAQQQAAGGGGGGGGGGEREWDPERHRPVAGEVPILALLEAVPEYLGLPPHLRGEGKDDHPTWDHFGGSWGKRRRNGTPASPKFYIGDVVRHAQWKYRGVVIGWDFTANAPSHWIKRVYEIYPSEWSDRPHYLLLVENAAPNSQIPEELYLAYVSEENLKYDYGGPIQNDRILTIFQGRAREPDGTSHRYYPPSGHPLRTIYPDDRIAYIVTQKAQEGGGGTHRRGGSDEGGPSERTRDEL